MSSKFGNEILQSSIQVPIKLICIKIGYQIAEGGGTVVDWAKAVGCSQSHLLQSYLPLFPELARQFRNNRQILPSRTDYWEQVYRFKLFCGIEYGLWSSTVVASVLGVSKAATTQYRKRYTSQGALFALAELMSPHEIDRFCGHLIEACRVFRPSPMDSPSNARRLSRNLPKALKPPMAMRKYPARYRFDSAEHRQNDVVGTIKHHWDMILCGKNISEQAFARHRLGIKHAARYRNESPPDVGLFHTKESMSDVGANAILQPTPRG